MKRSPLINPELLERIIDASEDGIVVAEQEGDENILIYVNKGFERLTGYSADEILYRDCRFCKTKTATRMRYRRSAKRYRMAAPRGKCCVTTVKTALCSGMSCQLRQFMTKPTT